MDEKQGSFGARNGGGGAELDRKHLMSQDEKECIFCKIVAGDLPTNKLFENDWVVAFADIAPKAPQHVLVVPKKHIANLNEIDDADRDLLANLMFSVRDVARKLGIGDAYQVKIYSGEKAGQTVFHLHIHVMGGWEKAQHH